jgi:hypothetical protein
MIYKGMNKLQLISATVVHLQAAKKNKHSGTLARLKLSMKKDGDTKQM